MTVILGSMRLPCSALVFCGVVALGGCHSASIDATIANRTAKPISLIELDYPSASFGTQALAPGAEYHYRFKVLGSGEVKLIYTDAHEVEQHAQGPELHEGDEGTLMVTIGANGPQWENHTAAHK